MTGNAEEQDRLEAERKALRNQQAWVDKLESLLEKNSTIPPGMSETEFHIMKLEEEANKIKIALREFRLSPGLINPHYMRLLEVYQDYIEIERQIAVDLHKSFALLKPAGETNQAESERIGRLRETTPDYERLVQRRSELTHLMNQLSDRNIDEAVLPKEEREKLRQIREKSSLYYSQLDIPDELWTCSALVYNLMREALAKNTFTSSADSPWPTASLSRGGIVGNAHLMPPVLDSQPLMPPEEQERWVQLMWRQREELSDLDADALDMLCHIWLKQANRPEDSAVAVVDEMLAMRKLKPKQNGEGRRGGYEPEQRTEMLRALSHIQSLWLNMGQVEIYEKDENGSSNTRTRAVKQTIQSRAFIVTDRLGQLNTNGYMEVDRFVYQPGKFFAKFLLGPGQQTALLSAKAVEYDPYRQKWEKRLTRYLSWQWRIQASRSDVTRSYRVATLLEVAGAETDTKRPNRLRERLEKALDTLRQDGVIAQWQYDPERWQEDWASRYGWLEYWQQALIVVEPPEVIREKYQTIEQNYNGRFGGAESSRMLKASAGILEPVMPEETSIENRLEPVGPALKHRRKAIGLSQLETAEQLGITQSYLSKLEKGQAKPTPEIQKRVKQWLNSTEF